MDKKDLALNNRQRLICRKIKPNQTKHSFWWYTTIVGQTRFVSSGTAINLEGIFQTKCTPFQD